MSSSARAEVQPRPYRVLIPLLNQRQAGDLLTIAQAMGRLRSESQPWRYQGAEATILGVAEVHDSSFSSARPLARAYRTLLNYMPPPQPTSHTGAAINVYTRVTTAHSVAQGIIEEAAIAATDLVIIWLNGPSREDGRIYGRICDEVMRGAPCDVLLAHIGSGGLSAVHEMMLAVRGGPYAEMALKLGQSLMPELGATLAVMHAPTSVSDNDNAPTPWDEPFRDIEEQLQGVAHRSIVGTGLAAITEQLAHHDLLIIGASGELHSNWTSSDGKPSTTEILSRLAYTMDKALLVAKTYQPLELLRYQRPRTITQVAADEQEEVGWSPSVMRPIVERWQVENSYEVTEFADYAHLAALKQRQGRQVSLCLLANAPSHNLKAMLRGLQTAVQENVSLVDEIVVLDGSAAVIPATLVPNGVKLYRHDAVLPEISTYAGPGCLLWKAVAASSGDIIAVLDLRAGRMISSSVAGLLGPLLEEAGLQMVIGGAAHQTSDTDWSLAAITEALRAGRSEAISALCARFFPPLAGVVEPNSYDLAINRQIAERLPLVAGDWAAVGLLLEVIVQCELKGLGQVELTRPPLENGQQLLHKVIGLLALIDRYVRSPSYRVGRARSIALAEVGELYRLLADKRLPSRRAIHEVELRELETWELPPLVSLPQYQQRQS